MNTNQELLTLQTSSGVALVSPDFAGAVTGYHIDVVMQMVENGTWPFAFDFSAGAKREVRELRIWIVCLTCPERARSLNSDSENIDRVIAELIGTDSADVRAAALETRWRISNQTIRRLLISSELRGRITSHTLWIERDSLVSFLRRRRVV